MNRHFGRRSFLAACAAALLTQAPVARGVEQTRKPSPRGARRVLVIGAGMAGLAAARTLTAQGLEVVVVEARERIGGRIWTSTRWPDLPVDLGASWIHGVDGNPLSTLADAAGARRLVTSYDRSIVYNAAGQELSAAEASRLAALRERIYARLAAAQRADDDSSLQAAVLPLLRGPSVDAEQARMVAFVLNSEFEQEYADSAARLSAHWYDDIREFGGDDALIAEGFHFILQYLASGLTIVTGEIVQEVDWRAAQVRVRGTTTEFVADRVIVTVPLGVLQARGMRFRPALPPARQDAIGRLGMGVLNKCCLRFPRVFWPPGPDWLEQVSDTPGEWTEWVSVARVTGKPVLLGFNAADHATALEAWSDQQIVARAMQSLQRLYGADIPAPTDWQVTRWASDPFARGSYSCNVVGATPDLRDVLAEPLDGRVFFAGEATDRYYFGTVHGAYLSGERAARELLSA